MEFFLQTQQAKTPLKFQLIIDWPVFAETRAMGVIHISLVGGFNPFEKY